MAPFFISLALAVCAGVLLNFLMEHKLSKLTLQFGGLGLAVAALGVLLRVLSYGEAFLAVLILFCTGLIIGETRKDKQDEA